METIGSEWLQLGMGITWSAARDEVSGIVSRGGSPLSVARSLWLVLAALPVVACGEPNTFQEPPAPKVTVSQPVRRPVTEHVELTGTTEAIRSVTLRARVEGYLDGVLFEDGEEVEEGQLLFEIQRNTYQAQVQQAEGKLAAERASLGLAQVELARFEAAAKTNAVSKADLDRHRYDRDRKRADVEQAKAQLDLARLDLGYTRITAPFAGRIGRRLHDPGNLVGAGEQTVLAEIAQIDPIYVYFTVDERTLLRVQGENRRSAEAGAEQRRPVAMGLVNEEGYPHQGFLDFASIRVDPNTGTLLLRGVFPNPEHRIVPGLFAQVSVPVGTAEPALLVPRLAISSDQVGDFVLVVGESNRVERRSVTPGPVVGPLRVVEKGLAEQDEVVVSGLMLAVPGREVTPEKKPIADPKAPAPAPRG